MASRKKTGARETLLNAVARKLGSAAGTVTRVTRGLSQDLLVSSGAAEKRGAPVAKKAVKQTPAKGARGGATGRTSKTQTTRSARKSGTPSVAKRREHRKPSRTASRLRSAGAATKAR